MISFELSKVNIDNILGIEPGLPGSHNRPLDHRPTFLDLNGNLNFCFSRCQIFIHLFNNTEDILLTIEIISQENITITKQKKNKTIIV